MQRFLMWTAALTVVFAMGVAAQANLTAEGHAMLMKANGQAAQATNKALGSGSVAEASGQGSSAHGQSRAGPGWPGGAPPGLPR